jgi:hypothetical protein
MDVSCADTVEKVFFDTSRNRLKGQGFVELVLKVGKNDNP